MTVTLIIIGEIGHIILFSLFVGICAFIVLPFLVFVWMQSYDPETLRAYTWIEKLLTSVLTLIFLAIVWRGLPL